MGVHTLTLPTLIKDNQDGGFTTYIFVDKKARLKHINEGRDKKFKMSELGGDKWDDYEDGYLGEATMKFLTVATGNSDPDLVLDDTIVIHGGQ